MKHKAFSLIELLVIVGIISVLATLVAVAILPTRGRSRDTVRKADLNTIGRYLWASQCYVPSGGAGDYDLKQIFNEVVAANPQVAKFINASPKDPRVGSDTVSGYRYLYDASGRCVLYANLERDDEPVTLPITTATVGNGTGVFQSATTGPNGTNRFYQFAR